MQFGAIVGNSATGFLIHIYDSWHVSFYVFGVIGIVVAAIYVSNEPCDVHDHRSPRARVSLSF